MEMVEDIEITKKEGDQKNAVILFFDALVHFLFFRVKTLSMNPINIKQPVIIL